MHCIVCHYHEVALKGGNRRFFELKLKEAIEKVLPKGSFSGVRILPGRLIVDLKEGNEEVASHLSRVFGLSHYALATSVPADLVKIKEGAYLLLQGKEGTTFKIEASRAEKAYPLTSVQINEQVGEYVLEKFPQLKVKLTSPDRTCFIEIVGKNAYLYTEKLLGAGGLPARSSGSVVSLISGGIDSPVASYLLGRRGAHVTLVHFHTYPYTSKASIEKVERMTEVLASYLLVKELVLVSFGEVQKEIVLKSPAPLRMILYRRAMARMAEMIGARSNALVTGESLGQVASQTLENIRTIDSAVELPILRPLIGMDKEEIIKIAQKIGTFAISILPHEDCCSRFLPEHPATRSEPAELEKIEEKLDLDRLRTEAVKNAEHRRYA